MPSPKCGWTVLCFVAVGRGLCQFFEKNSKKMSLSLSLESFEEGFIFSSGTLILMSR